MKFCDDMLYLSLCALNDTTPDKNLVEAIDLDSLFVSCENHKITALVSYALEKVVELPRCFAEAKGKAIRKNMLFDAQRQTILSFFEKNGIRYLPLKGIVLQEYYPKPGMRQMSDNDIFYDVNYRDKLYGFMISLGFKCTQKSDNHDVYEKQPIYNFEFHHALFLKETSQKLCGYYSDIYSRMIKDDDNLCGYHLSVEDFYIYLIAHEYKHYNRSGVGVRSLFDIVVMLKKYESVIDWEYISIETKKAGLDVFEKNQRNLCKKLMLSNNADISEAEAEFIRELLSGGVHGDFCTQIQNKLKADAKGSKLKYIFSRLFPPMHYYKRFYPFFYKHKYLVPVCFLYRIFMAMFVRNKTVKAELDVLRNVR